MTTKPTCLRLPVGILEAIDARKDANNDRTAIITSLLAAALSGEYIKPKDNTLSTIKHLSKTVKSLEAAVDKLSFQIDQQSKINSQIPVPVAKHKIVAKCKDIVVNNTGDDRYSAIEQISSDHPNFSDEDRISDNSNDEPEIEMINLNHDDFIQRFQYRVPANTLAILSNGEACKLVAISHNRVVIADPKRDINTRLSIDEVLLYRVPSEN